MQMKRTLALVVIGISLLASAYPWDNCGHMAVAGLAYDELTSAERTKIMAFLKSHPDLTPLKNGFPAGNIDDRSFFMAAATWPDLIRSDGEYTESREDPYDEHGVAVTKIDYHDMLKHRGWHFKDTFFDLDKKASVKLPAEPAVNAVGVVKVLVAQINSNESTTERGYDLMWLFHLVGDIHQPLHAASAVSTLFPKGDHGGNYVKLVGTSGARELHAYWDDLAGKTAKADKTTHHPHLEKDVATANTFIETARNTPLGANANNLDAAVWADESFKMAVADAYNLKTKAGTDSKGRPTLEATLDSNYERVALADAKLRIRLAGHRLALLLKQSLK